MIEEWLSAAAKKYPYYARGVAALTPVETPGMTTVAVTKEWHLLWSPRGLQHISGSGGEPAECIRHELEHLLREHARRREHREPQAWNVAGDQEINDDLDRDLLPCWACYPRSGHEHRTAEEYYQESSTGNACGGGSGAGSPLPTEPTGGGVPVDAAGVLLDAIAGDVVAHDRSHPGTVPSGVLLWSFARVGKAPKGIDPACRVRGLVGEILRGRADYSYARLPRGQVHAAITPASVVRHPFVVVVLDTSGSMRDRADVLAAALTVVQRLSSRALLVDCDATVHAVRPLHSWRDLLKSRGGGGTDMRVGVDRALRLGADLVLVLSDGDTPWFDCPPRKVKLVLV